MNITVLCTDAAHPVNSYLDAWIKGVADRHSIRLVRSRSELSSGDFLFLVSCAEIIKAKHRNNFRHTLVLHASDLPSGRGWSPHVWEVVQGSGSITLSLLEAEDKVDTGRIWLKTQIPVDKTALWDEVNHQLFKAEINLMDEAVDRHDKIEPYDQSPDIEPTYFRKRTPMDSQLDPEQNIVDQFNLLRMCDPMRYPAWFELYGQKYRIIVEKMDHE